MHINVNQHKYYVQELKKHYYPSVTAVQHSAQSSQGQLCVWIQCRVVTYRTVKSLL